MATEIRGRAVAAGAAVSFLFGMLAVVTAADSTLGAVRSPELLGAVQSPELLLTGAFAAASGGVVAALVADVGLQDDAMNALVGDLVSSLLFLILLMARLPPPQRSDRILRWMLGMAFIAVSIVGSVVVVSGLIAMGAGWAASWIRQWRRGVTGAPAITGRAVAAGATVSFVLGMFVVLPTLGVSMFGNEWTELPVWGGFAAGAVAAASGGVVAALVADVGVQGDAMNALVGDLVSSLLFYLYVMARIVLAVHSDGTAGLLGILGLIQVYAIPIAGFVAGVSAMIAMMAGMVASWLRQRGREMSTE